MVATLPGKLTTDVCIRLRNWDMSCCRNVVVYVGGNDVAAGNSMTSIEHELRRMLECLNDGRRRVFLRTVCPRRDVNVNIFNAMIRNVCSTTYAEPIEVHSVFAYGDGSSAHNLFHADGIHLNLRGSSTLVKTLNSAVSIIRKVPRSGNGFTEYGRAPTNRNPSSMPAWDRHCDNCMMFNHNTWECRRPSQRQAGPPEFNSSVVREYRLSHGGPGNGRRNFQSGRDTFA